MSASRTQWVAGAVVAMTSVVALAAMAAATTGEPGGDEGTAPSGSEVGGVESTTPMMTAPGGAFDQQFCDTWLEHLSRPSGADPKIRPSWPRGIPKRPHPSSPSCADTCRPRSPMPSTRTWMPSSSSPTSGDSVALFSPETGTAVTTIYPSLADGCGITVVSALLTDYDFGGVPETLTAGPTAFVVLNDSEEGEAHEMVVMV